MITSEQLKKFAEAGGWVHAGNCLHKTVDGEWHCFSFRPADGYLTETPEFLTDLPACFDVLERVCEQSNFGWRVERTDSLRCLIFRRGLIVRDPAVGYSKAKTKQEAIILAVLAACQKSHEPVKDSVKP